MTEAFKIQRESDLQPELVSAEAYCEEAEAAGAEVSERAIHERIVTECGEASEYLSPAESALRLSRLCLRVRQHGEASQALYRLWRRRYEAQDKSYRALTYHLAKILQHAHATGELAAPAIRSKDNPYAITVYCRDKEPGYVAKEPYALPYRCRRIVTRIGWKDLGTEVGKCVKQAAETHGVSSDAARDIASLAAHHVCDWLAQHGKVEAIPSELRNYIEETGEVPKDVEVSEAVTFAVVKDCTKKGGTA